MGITHAEFFRLIPIALGTDQYSVSANGIKMTNGDTAVDIALGPEGIRQIALLVVPRTSVRLTLEGFSGAATDEFMVKFDRAFQRGGG